VSFFIYSFILISSTDFLLLTICDGILTLEFVFKIILYRMMVECEAQYSELGEEQFTVTPSTVVLNPPVLNEATVIVLGSFKAAQAFQTSLSNSNYFSVVPTEGMLPSRKGFPLRIKCSQRIERNTQAVLEIYTENNKQDVLINVIVKRQ